MPVWVNCPQCDQHYQFPDTSAGKQAACPKCGRLLSVSAPAPAPMPIPPMPRAPMPAPAPPPVPPGLDDDKEAPLWAVPVSRKGSRPVSQDDEDRPRPRRPPFDDRRSAAPPTPPPIPSRRPPVRESPPEEGSATLLSGPLNTYYHEACGGSTMVSAEVAARISGDPFSFIPATFCAKCRRYVGLRAVVWQGTRETLAAYRKHLRKRMHPLKKVLRLFGGPLIGAGIGALIGAVANAHALTLGILAGVLIGLPLGYFVTGIVFQVGWSMSPKNRGIASTGGRTRSVGGG